MPEQLRIPVVRRHAHLVGTATPDECSLLSTSGMAASSCADPCPARLRQCMRSAACPERMQWGHDEQVSKALIASSRLPLVR